MVQNCSGSPAVFFFFLPPFFGMLFFAQQSRKSLPQRSKKDLGLLRHSFFQHANESKKIKISSALSIISFRALVSRQINTIIPVRNASIICAPSICTHQFVVEVAVPIPILFCSKILFPSPWMMSEHDQTLYRLPTAAPLSSILCQEQG